MDFLSKLLGKDKKDIEKAAKGFMNNLAGGTTPAPSSGSKQTAAKPASGFS